MTEQLPEALRTLIGAEKASPVVTEVAQLAVRAKLGATLGIAKTVTGGALAATTATVTKLKILALVVAAGSTTAAVVTTNDRPLVAATVKPPRQIVASVVLAANETVVPVEREPIEPSRSAVALELAEPSLTVDSPPAPAVVPRRVTAPRRPSPPEPIEIPSQAALLADASRALAAKDAGRALAILDEDLKHHPSGPLAEERDALRISVLVTLERTDDARHEAREMLARYPQSLHRALAERVLTKDSR